VLIVIASAASGGVALVLDVKYYFFVKHGHFSSKLSERTRQLQMMLYRAQTIQLAFYFVFQIGPALAAMFLGMHIVEAVLKCPYLVPNDELIAWGLAFTSFHSFFDYFAILYFIRPYRY
jgi:Serpentine type 7TM GPCR chemoreceptor Srh